jgi:PQQ system protein
MPRKRLLLPLLAAVALSSCEYAKLLRPSVLKQLNPRVVRLVNELPRVDDPNEEVVARLFAHGGLDRARVGSDGVMRATVRVGRASTSGTPAVIVMPRGGELEIDFYNEDPFSYHAAFLPNVGNREALFLPINTRGRARIRLDQPGMYWFGCPVANHVQRGMLGLIMVSGEVPPEAKLDRPRQHRH